MPKRAPSPALNRLVALVRLWISVWSCASAAALTPDEKATLCAKDFALYDKPLSLVQVTAGVNPNAVPPSYPRVFCFMYTISPWHETRAQAVVDTWGQRCHKLVVFSNATYDFAPVNVNLMELREQQERVAQQQDQTFEEFGNQTEIQPVLAGTTSTGSSDENTTATSAVRNALREAAATPAVRDANSTNSANRANSTNSANSANGVNSTVEVVVLDIPADYAHLWQRHRTALKYVYDQFRDDFDWFYKADDDTYVIMENLHEYLKRPEITMKVLMEPIQLGHRFNMDNQTVKFYTDRMNFSDQYYARFDRWVFNSGGPGYAMNGLYLDKIIETLHEETCFSDEQSHTVPEDSSTAFCMMWHGVFPWDTRDLQGRERWHAFNPSDAYYATKEDPTYWYVAYHNTIGDLRPGDACCAPDSVAYHYMTPESMYHAERKFYFCRSNEFDLDAFNQKYQLAISNKILIAPI